ncbi:MAG: hypothetical protein IJ430_09240 [Parabacteroides sp.]|nr:hypothetical protein [Parabacteroides sp.]
MVSRSRYFGDEYARQKLVELSSNNLNNTQGTSPRERCLLNRLREKLGISEARAQELEASLLKFQLTDEEKEYIEEYMACLEEKHNFRQERRLEKVLGISSERANLLKTFWRER